jgi:hypothetical protein
MQTESMGGVLSFMFGAWALSNWALAFELCSWKLERGRFLCFLMAPALLKRWHPYSISTTNA